MGEAKEIRLEPISCREARELVARVHYSGKFVNNSQFHVGAFFRGRLEGAMQFGPPMCRRLVIGLVRGTPWNGMIELNRMAFSESLPRNSESRALGVALRVLKKYKPSLQWVLSFADASQCGDGTIYRAAGFVLTGISASEMWELPEDLARINGGPVAHKLTIQCKGGRLSQEVLRRTRGQNLTVPEYVRRFGGRRLPGFQMRYIYFLQPGVRERLTVPILPFSEIARLGAGMYRGQRRAGSIDADAPASQAGEGGSNPTPALQ